MPSFAQLRRAFSKYGGISTTSIPYWSMQRSLDPAMVPPQPGSLSAMSERVKLGEGNLGDQEGINRDAQADVVVNAPPVVPFVVAKTEFLLEFAAVLFDASAPVFLGTSGHSVLWCP